MTGNSDVATLDKAYVTLKPLLGNAASYIFGISLLASGLSSSAVGTSAGQIIMEGFIHKHIPVWLRRLVTVVPSLAVIFAGPRAHEGPRAEPGSPELRPPGHGLLPPPLHRRQEDHGRPREQADSRISASARPPS